MKNILSLTLLIFYLLGAAQQNEEVYMFSYFKGNGQDGLHLAYSFDGLNWTALKDDSSFLKPAAGRDRLMRDPCIIVGPDGLFHMAWTVSWFEKGIGYANSPDLIRWSEQKYIPIMEHEPDARNCWAPELFYDEDNDEFMIYWSTTIPGRFPETDTLGDQNLNHRLYYITTNNFNDFSETGLLFNPGFNVIDAVIVKEDDAYIMFLKNETLKPEPEKNIRIARSRYLTHGWGEVSEAITPHWCEGPTVTKIDGKWIVYYDMYRKHVMGAVMSEDLKKWTDITGQLKFPGGTRHGTVFKITRDALDKLR